MNNLRSETRGAALIVAILILAILLVIVLAFFQASRQEMHIASNYRNAIQADLLAEGGTAIAQAFLNHDFLIHPTATSLDGAWKTYFNNAWAVGKPYLWANGPAGPRMTREPGWAEVPVINLDTLPDIGDYFYVPRVQPTSDTGPPPTLAAYLNYPFAVDYAGGQSGLLTQGLSTMGELAADNYGVEHIHAFADWDNDGDGLRDSAWIPMPMDRFFPNDGIDNDLDGYIDEGVEDGFDGDGNGIIDDPGELNQPVERGLFVYWGGDDGLDNDGDGIADEVDERRPYLTTPLGPIDMDGNGTFENLDMFAVAYMDAAGVPLTMSLNPNRGSSDIDRLDNDHDLVINEGNYHFYARPTTTPFTPDQAEFVRRQEANGFYPIHTNYVDVSAIAPAPPPDSTWIVTFSGEPVCEIVGRVAILIKDENSKVNLNIAGGRNYRDVDSPFVVTGTGLAASAVRRALWTGATTFEYESRVMPQLGTVRTDHLWDLRMGGLQGIGFPSVHLNTFNSANWPPYFVNPDPQQPADGGYGVTFASRSYDFDVSLPGFGRVDDNGNALWMAMDGIDNDGDGQIDEGLADLPGIDPVTNRIGYNGLWDPVEAWVFEGIDEPGEFQAYRPLRNRDPNPDDNYLLAEEDGVDNFPTAVADMAPEDIDRSIDEIGELGDRYLRSTEQMKLARTMASGIYNLNRTLATVNALDLNSRFQRFDDAGFLLPAPKYSGPKLDFNYALPMQIADAITRDWGYLPLNLGATEVGRYALGLRREDTAVFAPATGILAGTVNNPGVNDPAFPPDPALRAAQLAVNIRDNRDLRMGRSETTTVVNDDWWGTDVQPLIQPTRRIAHTQTGIESIRINEIMARPVRRVETETDDRLAPVVNFSPNAFMQGATKDFDFGTDTAGSPWVKQVSVAFDQYLAPVPPDNVWTQQGLVIGDRSYFRTQGRTLQPEQAFAAPMPNVIQFRFGPCPGLPTVQPATTLLETDPQIGARYYLLLNTLRTNLEGRLERTADSSDDLEFVIKYGTGAQDILADMNPGVQDNFDPWTSPQIIRQNAIVGGRNGDVFLPSTASSANRFQSPNGGWYNVDEAYTVHIPPVNTVDTTQQLYLYVAVRIPEGAVLPDFGEIDPATGNPSPGTLALNHFDFSQEPDHEWVEIVNIAEGGNPINLSGWDLAVGPEIGASGQTVATIPPGTQIAPGGSLLLGFNKFEDLTSNNLLLRNFISLTRSSLAMYGNFELTVPPIAGTPPATPLDDTYSVFYRTLANAYDFVDNDGDGILDPNGVDLNGDGRLSYDLDGDTIFDSDVADRFFQSTPDPLTGNNLGTVPNQPWDRIVQLRSPDVQSVRTLDDLAGILLRGGIFPNYPEQDGIDNDGDEATLAGDLVDNNGDGVVDGVDALDGRNEGVDEGRWEYSAGAVSTLPFGLRGFVAPAAYGNDIVPYVYLRQNDPDPLVAPVLTAINPPYLGTFSDPPEWKAFQERRWYPGDNVIVTLYEGTAASGRVVDRVTYTERDVINRAIDDIVECPYGIDTNGNGVLDPDPLVDTDGDGYLDPGERYNLNGMYPSFWPDNSMAVDFYRSIERKHPLYNGDLHGLSNRWQATDGNYDDWSPSTSLWERDPLTLAVTTRLADAVKTERFAHAFRGSPLRMNLAQRYMENPVNQFGVNAASGTRWAFDRARIRNKTYVSPGDLVTLPSFMDRQDFRNVSDLALINSTPYLDESMEGVLVGQHPYDDLANRDDLAAVVSTTAMDPVVLTAGQANYYSVWPQQTILANGWAGDGATAPEPFAPVFLFQMPIGDAGYVTGGAPFPLDPNSAIRYTMDNPLANFLFAPPFDNAGTTLNAAAFPAPLNDLDVAARWPLQLRSVMYASGNMLGFNPDLPRDDLSAITPTTPPANPASVALFEWDGADGLENGDYDIYISTIDDLSPVRAAADRAAAGGISYLTPFGDTFVNSSLATIPQNMVVDVEVFTDRGVRGQPNPYLPGNTQGAPLGPNGRCWIDTNNDNYPQPAEFERGADAGYYTPGDSFGMLVGKRPDEEGRIYYGTVRVENNYLAVLLRNWSARGQLMRFSRVILTPRPRTHGRININTVETAEAAFPNLEEFNPLVGMPGLLGTFAPAHSDPALMFSLFNEGNLSPGADPYPQAMLLAASVVANRERFTADTPPLPIRAHPDGRYYDSTSGLMTPHPFEPTGFPNILSTLTAGFDTGVYFDEVKERYSRLANLATVRSDVFEITVTAQTGYVSGEDLNNDGRLDYRNDFIATGEKKLRTVYER